MNIKTKPHSHIVITFAILIFLACGKDKPTGPDPQGHMVILAYQDYFPFGGNYWGCLALDMGDGRSDACGLGCFNTGYYAAGDYEWVLYVFCEHQQPEPVYYPVASGRVTIERNITCKVNGNEVTWL